ncbi:hypothetical protein [Moorella sp. E308F]|uniref:hypothetical protein n=1 Tax=Moorella sp. E308F TaxID=2572682 RepID=UPI001C0F1599|nr:hypothetical protein [Moorella sp. E308F]
MVEVGTPAGIQRQGLCGHQRLRPGSRMDGERLQLVIDRITRTATEISAGLGY